MLPALSISKTPDIDQALLNAPRAILISGTLGSGKTTLLNHLLSKASELSRPGSFIVIENDIGTTNTDRVRLKTDPANVLEITAGCICCNDLSSLQVALKQLQRQPEIKTYLIETTGIAKPAEVKNLLHRLSIPALTIVTLDVKHFERNQQLGRTKDTVPHADILALTWTQDGTGQRDSAALERVLSEVEKLNPMAQRVEISPSGEPAAALSLSAPGIKGHDSPAASTRQGLSAPLEELSLIGTGDSFFSRVLRKTHREFTLTFPLRDDLTPDEVIEGIKAGAPTGLLRAKGQVGRFDLDCTMGDWNISQKRGGAERNFITLIGTEPLEASSFTRLASTAASDAASLDLTNPMVRERAVQLVRELMSQIPESVVRDGQLMTQTDAAEGWRYVTLPGFPADLKESFARALCGFYLKQSEALQSEQFKSHPNLPYYQREVGGNLSWFLIDCNELLRTWDLEGVVRASRPVTLYFSGLNSARDARHIGSFKEDDAAFLERQLAALSQEKTPLSFATNAVSNCATLSLDKTWNRALKILRAFEDRARSAEAIP